jgi:septum formation protein
MANSKVKFILASTSPRRKELIGHLKVPFEIMSLNVPEESNQTDPVLFSQEISDLKGKAVFDKLLHENSQNTYYVVSADTIVSLNGKIYGKPRDREEARQFLSELSGREHSVFTAVTVNFVHQSKKDSFSFVEETKVTFGRISDALMERYLDTGDSLDKAGAYGIQGGSLAFITKVNGDYANVVGFPLSRFVAESKKFLKAKFPQEALWLNLF